MQREVMSAESRLGRTFPRDRDGLVGEMPPPPLSVPHSSLSVYFGAPCGSPCSPLRASRSNGPLPSPAGLAGSVFFLIN